MNANLVLGSIVHEECTHPDGVATCVNHLCVDLAGQVIHCDTSHGESLSSFIVYYKANGFATLRQLRKYLTTTKENYGSSWNTTTLWIDSPESFQFVIKKALSNVDASEVLDDANLARFADLVYTMGATVWLK